VTGAPFVVTPGPGSLSEAVRAAMLEAATRSILPRYRRLAAHEVTEKAVGESVTIADRESEEILSTRLAALLPDASVVGEEAVHLDPSLMDRLGQGLCWIIDPLDGTANFANGQPPFGLLVALAEGPHVIGGWILDPLTGRFCAAECGKGAYVDGQPFRSRPTHEMRPLVAISRLFADQHRRAALVAGLSDRYRVVDSPRCAADQYPRVAFGENDLTIFERTIVWDHAAGVLFINEAGGRAARLDGSPYRVDDDRTGMIVATTPELWDGLAARIAALGNAVHGRA